MVDLESSLVSEKKRITILRINARNDECKVENVNSPLIDMCKTLDIDFIDNSSFNPKKDIKNSKLHLKGSLKCSQIFVKLYLKFM